MKPQSILSILLFLALLSCEKLTISDRHVKFGPQKDSTEVYAKARLDPLAGATLTCTNPRLIDEYLDRWSYPDTCILRYKWLEVHQYFDKPLKIIVEENKTGQKRELSFSVSVANLSNYIKVTQKGK